MSNEIQDILTPLANRQDLSFEQATRAFHIIMQGTATPAQMAAFLMGLRQKGETVDEITAGATLMRQKALQLNAPSGTIDTCGTGGDAKGTLNVSTAVALVLAACGVPVAKHGNRAVTSASGSADVLQKLGVKIDAKPEIVERCLRECNIGFLFAPLFHSAARHVAPVRTELGLRTIFNLLGPLSNPAKPTLQLMGVYDRKWLLPLAQVLHRLGSEKAWVVCGEDGMDELSISAPTHIVMLDHGNITETTITPEDAGLERAELSAIRGGDAEDNAKAISALLGGTMGAYADIVALNTAAALIVAGKEADLKAGVATAREAIASGKARETLGALAHTSHL